MKPHLAILGSGPTGIDAALAAAEAGYPFTLYEVSPQVAGHVVQWSHVRLFTPWSMSVSPRMREALGALGREVPSNGACPTGGDLVEQVFKPLASSPALVEHLQLGTRVLRIGREGLLKHEEIGTADRGARPFRLLVEDSSGQRVDEAHIVLDCTGNSEPNPVGASGIPAPGEGELGEKISFSIPQVDDDLPLWRSRRVLLVGAGHSAQTALIALVKAGVEVVWILRQESTDLGLVEGDSLSERATLTNTALDLLREQPSNLVVLRGAVVEAFKPSGNGIDVELGRSNGKTITVHVDHVLALTGRVGDHQLYRQLQVHECYATQGPMKLAATLLGASGAGGDCMEQTSLGAETLKNPEPGFFILGSKSYGRRNDFLMRVGWEQVGEVFELIGQID